MKSKTTILMTLAVMAVATTIGMQPAFAEQVTDYHILYDDCGDGNGIQTKVSNNGPGNTLTISVDHAGTINWQCSGEPNKSWSDADVYISQGGDSCLIDFDQSNESATCSSVDINPGEYFYMQVDVKYGSGSSAVYGEWSGWHQM
ncbi:MAG: hypothetical protein GKS07_07375 [Nitrosopumilus sp.]|nr:MAG: hypothetical protein GKS07_07375 [Nitrosopumilus sp.]